MVGVRLSGYCYQMLVSIVTPSFNQGSFIAETIASILDQDYSDLEYLVVDGGSTDRTLEILRGFGDRFRWVSEPDRGQSDAINKGWRKARGEILAWLNSDDLYRPGAVRKVVAFFKQHPGVDLVYGNCDSIDERGDVIERHHMRSANALDLLRSPVSLIAQPATFFRRHVLETVGFLDERLYYTMDFDYWIRVASRHAIAHLPECLAAMRIHGEAKTVRAPLQRVEERVSVYERFFTTPNLPDDVRAVEREAMRNAYARLASDYFLTGDMKRARRYALAGWRYLPWQLQASQLKVFGLGLMGRQGIRLAEMFRK